MKGKSAVHPMSKPATSAADDAFYSSHPEMIKDGKKQPIDPHDPNQAKLHHEWLQSYAGHGGAVRKITSKAKAEQVRNVALQTQALPATVGTAAAVASCPYQA